MLNSETILLSPDCKNISLENYVIGYKTEGESTVVFLKQDDRVMFSMVIDSYQKSTNATIDILNSNNVKSLDFLVWTHPHKDHSEGIECFLTDFCSRDTKVIIPNIDTASFNDIPENCKNKYNAFSRINSNGAMSNGVVVYGEYNNVVKKYNFIWNGKIVDFTICCLSPTSTLLANDKFNKTTNINDFSVSLIIIFNGNIFLYGADIENKAINSLKMNSIYLKNVAFIKAPHHGSHSTSKIFDVVDINENTVCTITNFKAGDIDLPENDIVESYSNKSDEVFLFNDSNSDEFGIVSSSFNMYSINEMIYETKTSGIAYHYCNKNNLNELN